MKKPVSAIRFRVGVSAIPQSHILSCISMDSDAVTVLPRFGGDFSGDEKIPEIGSRPCSSYMPRSVSVMPVFLCCDQYMRVVLTACCAYLPCTPTL